MMTPNTTIPGHQFSDVLEQESGMQQNTGNSAFILGDNNDSVDHLIYSVVGGSESDDDIDDDDDLDEDDLDDDDLDVDDVDVVEGDEEDGVAEVTPTDDDLDDDDDLLDEDDDDDEDDVI